ncbi:MAG: 6-bladed beta-propeller [Candidatus Firestonebacteria bacterium]|nr:6-bladed beta-propeller [Candidatus Firestonebacteria bacterium]
MNKIFKYFISVLLFTLTIFIFFVQKSESFSRYKEGDPLYDFTAKDLNNNRITFSSYINNKDNKVVALFFWKVPEGSDYRNYSEEEITLLQKLYKHYQVYGLEIVGLYCPWGDENPGIEEMSKIKEILKKNSISFPILIDYGLNVYNKFVVSALPSIILVKDNKGKYILAGYPQFAEKSIKQEIEKLMEIEEDKKLKEVSTFYAFETKQPGAFRSNFINDKLWGEKLILTFYGKHGDKGLNNPTSFAIGENGQIYVVDSLNAVVNVYDMFGRYLFSFGHEGFGGENMAFPWGITIDYKGRIYLTDIAKNLICIYDSDGKFLIKFGGTGDGEGKFNMPFDLTIDSNNNLYVVDSQNNRVQVINGKFKNQIGHTGSKDEEFLLPTAITLSKNEKMIYILDTNNCRVQIFDTRGNFVRKFGRPGSQKGEFNHPEGIAVDAEGRIYVSDTLNNRIQIFDPEGNFLCMFGNFGSGEGEFNSPGKSYIDMIGRFYVIDRKNNRIQGFNTKYIQTFLPASKQKEGL